MKKVRLRFEKDESIEHIDIAVRAAARDDQVEELMKQFAPEGPRQFTVLDQYGVSCVINEKDIISVQSDGKNVRVITAQEMYRVRQTLQNTEEILNENDFLRISRFEIINLTKVHKYDFTIVGMLRVELEGGMETWASRRYIPLIRKKISREEGYLC